MSDREVGFEVSRDILEETKTPIDIRYQPVLRASKETVERRRKQWWNEYAKSRSGDTQIRRSELHCKQHVGPK